MKKIKKDINRTKQTTNKNPVRKKRRYKKTFFQKRYKEILILGAIFVFFLFSILHNEHTFLLSIEKDITTESAESYIFTNSEYLDLNEEQTIKYSVKEGQKVGANTVLSKDYKITTNKYIDDAISVIDWRLEHGSYENRDVFFKDLSDLDDDIKNAENEYNKAKSSNNSSKMNEYSSKLANLKNQKEMMQKSMKYIFADDETLNKLKSELKNKKTSTKKDLTISNLNFSFTGYIYFSRTGYEEVLNTNIMAALDGEYIDYLRSFKPESTNDDMSIIKIVNNQCAYICSVVDKDTYIDGEEEAKEYNTSVKKNHDLKSDAEYYDYLLTRVDMLITYPTIKFEDETGKINQGYLINSLNYGEDKKILVICLKDDFSHLINIDKTKFNIYTNEVNVYKIPKKAIIEKDGKTYVYAKTSGNFKDLVEVKIYQDGFFNVLLKPSENENLTENMEIISNPT